MTVRALFEVGAGLREFDACLDEIGGEFPDAETEAALTARFAGLMADQGVALDGVYGLIREAESRAAVMKAEEDRYAARRKSEENKAARLKELVKTFLEATNQPSVKTAAGRTFRVQANGGAMRPVKDTEDAAAVPERFHQTRVVIDWGRVADAIRAGEDVGFARLVAPSGTHLRFG